MKKLQRNFTNQEQSKRLLELGVPADSADICYKINNELMRFDRIPTAIPYKDFTAKEFYCPCWSVGRLIEIYCLATGVEYIKIGTSEISLTELMIKMIEIAVKVKTFDFSKLEE